MLILSGDTFLCRSVYSRHFSFRVLHKKLNRQRNYFSWKHFSLLFFVKKVTYELFWSRLLFLWNIIYLLNCFYMRTLLLTKLFLCCFPVENTFAKNNILIYIFQPIRINRSKSRLPVYYHQTSLACERLSNTAHRAIFQERFI